MVEMVVAVKNGAVMAMAVMAIEPSCKGQRGPVHVNIKVSDRRGTSFHTMVRTRFTFFGEDSVSKTRKPTCARRTLVRADVFQHAPMLAGARRPLAARTSAAR